MKALLIALTLAATPLHAGGPVIIEDAAETSADVARRFAHRWPEILSWGAFVAVAMLSATRWLA